MGVVVAVLLLGLMVLGLFKIIDLLDAALALLRRRGRSQEPVEEDKLGLVDLQGKARLETVGRADVRHDSLGLADAYVEGRVRPPGWFRSLYDADPDVKAKAQEAEKLEEQAELEEYVRKLDEDNPHLTAEVVARVVAPSDPAVARFVGADPTPLSTPDEDKQYGPPVKVTED